jgi:hypothetical protein
MKIITPYNFGRIPRLRGLSEAGRGSAVFVNIPADSDPPRGRPRFVIITSDETGRAFEKIPWQDFGSYSQAQGRIGVAGTVPSDTRYCAMCRYFRGFL